MSNDIDSAATADNNDPVHRALHEVLRLRDEQRSDQLTHFLETLPDDVKREVEEHLRREEDCREDWEGIRSDATLRPFAHPRELGNYTLLEEVGRGGMGIVYKARQRVLDTDGHEKVNRVVAVKLILRGQLASKDERDRFRSEIKAASGLQKKGIVHVYEVGQDRGHDFYSMPYIEGKDLNRSVENGPMDSRVAADLVARIARAIQHAHDCNIIHRDLKPHNVLIDKEGDPWVTDFGCAKRTEADSKLTETGRIIGTPQYMSPEQAYGPANVTPLTDVYALGALLYFLITGNPPFRGNDQVAILRQVMDEEPKPPRWHISTVPRDLETICLTSMRKEPQRRYRSAASLAEDLENFINHRPIQATRDGAWERFCKVCRRNPRLSAATAVFIVVLLAVVFGAWRRELNLRIDAQNARDAAKASWTIADNQRVQAEKNEKIAKTQRRLAENNETIGLEALDQIYKNVVDDPAVSARDRQLLQVIAKAYRDFANANKDNPSRHRQVAQRCRRIGNLQRRLGNLAEAREALELAIKLLESLLSTNVADSDETLTELIASWDQLGSINKQKQQWQDADECFGEALAAYKRLTADARMNSDNRWLLASVLHHQGQLYSSQKKDQLARERFRESLSILEKLPDESNYRSDEGSVAASLAGLLRRLKTDDESAEDFLLRARDAFMSPSVYDHASSYLRQSYRQRLVVTLHDLGWLYQQQSRLQDAVTEYGRAIDLAESLLSERPDFVEPRRTRASAYHNRAQTFVKMSRPSDAADDYQRAVSQFEDLHDEFPAVPAYRRNLAIALMNWGNLLESDDKEKAESLLMRALVTFEQLSAEFSHVPDFLDDCAWAHNEMGLFFKRQGRWDEAERHFQKAIVQWHRLHRDHPRALAFAESLGGAKGNLGALLMRDASRRVESKEILDSAKKILEQVLAAEAKRETAKRFLEDVDASLKILDPC